MLLNREMLNLAFSTRTKLAIAEYLLRQSVLDLHKLTGDGGPITTACHEAHTSVLKTLARLDIFIKRIP